VLALRWTAAALFVACIPVFLVLTNVRLAANWERVYDYAFSQYDVVAVTGVSRPELDRSASEIVRYFQSGEDGELLDIRVERGDDTVPLFNQREILHMADVKDLFRLVYRIHEFTFIYIVAYVAGVYLWSRERSMRRLARQAITAGIVTVGALMAAAVGVVLGFDTLFEQFHLLSFSNDFWQLDPRTDRLVQMFPMGFWFDVTLGVGILSIVAGGLVALAGLGYSLWLDREVARRRLQRRRRRPLAAPPAPPEGATEA